MITRWTSLRSDGERGAAFILTGVSLVVLMVFAAFAVDLSAARVERRQVQGAVDVANLSGAQMTAGVGASAAIAAVETEVRRSSAVNYGTSDAEWDVCTDPDRPAEFTITATGTQCISFNANLSKIRVRSPIQQVDTSFATVIGINTLDVTAFSEVAYDIVQAGDIIPFGLPTAAAGGVEICLKSGVGPLPTPPCDGPATGNFGFADLTHFGGSYGGVDYPEQCNGQINGRLARNIANGVDHLIVGKSPQPAVHLEDRDVCNDPIAPNILGLPYSLDVKTGTPNWVLSDGLISGASGYPGGGPNLPGRLTIGPFVGGPAVTGSQLDYAPLWSFYGPGVTFGPNPAAHDAPDSCAPAVITAAPVPHDAMGQCIADYRSAGYSGVLFTKDTLGNPPGFYDLQQSQRWALVPEFYTNFGPGGSTIHDVRTLRPVFVQTLYQCTGMTCREHNPAEGSTLAGGNLDAATAFLIPLSMLPEDVRDLINDPLQGVDYLLDR